MIVMYAYRVRSRPGAPFGVVRLDSEREARADVERINAMGGGWQAKYVGKVRVSLARVGVTNADPRKRSRPKRSRR